MNKTIEIPMYNFQEKATNTKFNLVQAKTVNKITQVRLQSVPQLKKLLDLPLIL